MTRATRTTLTLALAAALLVPGACARQSAHPDPIARISIETELDGGHHGRRTFVRHIDVTTACAYRRADDSLGSSSVHEQNCAYAAELRPLIAALVRAIEEERPADALTPARPSSTRSLEICRESGRCRTTDEPALLRRGHEIIRALDWPSPEQRYADSRDGWTALTMVNPAIARRQTLRANGVWECEQLAGKEICREDVGDGEQCDEYDARVHRRRRLGRLDEDTASTLLDALARSAASQHAGWSATLRRDSAVEVAQAQVLAVDAAVAVRRWNALIGAQDPLCAVEER